MFTSSKYMQIDNKRNRSSIFAFAEDGTPFPALRQAAYAIVNVAVLVVLVGLAVGSSIVVVVAALIAVINVYALRKLSFHTSNEDPREAQKCLPSTCWFACDTWVRAFRSIMRSSVSDPHGTARWINYAVADTVRCIKWHLRHAVVIKGLCDGLCKTLPWPDP
ncbi:MAG TPA: hypothetical protein VF292_03150 [Rhodanobacteraceae bacterium]